MDHISIFAMRSLLYNFLGRLSSTDVTKYMQLGVIEQPFRRLQMQSDWKSDRIV